MIYSIFFWIASQATYDGRKRFVIANLRSNPGEIMKIRRKDMKNIFKTTKFLEIIIFIRTFYIKSSGYADIPSAHLSYNLVFSK